MSREWLYLDYAATTPVDPCVAEVMQRYLTFADEFGNPSAQHAAGRAAMRAVDEAAGSLAALVNCDPGRLVWTSGATESNNLAIKGAAHFYHKKGKHIITLKTEHKAVLDTCRQLEREGYEVTYLDPEANGLLDLAKLEAALRDDTILVSVMHVNNEIGVIQDIKAIGQICRENKDIAQIMESLSNGTFSHGDRNLFQPLVDSLMSPHDQYLLLRDLESYLESQDRVNETFLDPELWTQMAILNVARMGKFSTDRTIRQYANEIWGIDV